jgi:lipopolysaccharide biosynthesis glycosyltransferase
MKIALVTMLNEPFIKGFKAMINSLIRFNPWFNFPILILDCGLTEKSKEELSKKYSSIEFYAIEKKNYEKVKFECTLPKLRDTYYKLEIFSFYDWDRLVFIDSDVIILGDIKVLFECNEPFSAVKGYDSNNDIMRREFNSGVFTINKSVINEVVYKQLINLAEIGHKMPDQRTLNIYFKKRINFLDKIYNVEKRMLYTKNFKDKLMNARILHFVGEKPWQKKTNIVEEQYATLERKWFEYYHE